MRRLGMIFALAAMLLTNSAEAGRRNKCCKPVKTHCHKQKSCCEQTPCCAPAPAPCCEQAPACGGCVSTGNSGCNIVTASCGNDCGAITTCGHRRNRGCNRGCNSGCDNGCSTGCGVAAPAAAPADAPAAAPAVEEAPAPPAPPAAA